MAFRTRRKDGDLATATLTSKGQVTTPQQVRQTLGLHTSDKADFVPDVCRAFNVVAPRKDVTALRGRFAGRGAKLHRSGSGPDRSRHSIDSVSGAEGSGKRNAGWSFPRRRELRVLEKKRRWVPAGACPREAGTGWG